MAKKKLKKNKNGFPVLSLNFEKLKDKLYAKKGIIPTNKALSKETKLSLVTLTTWGYELPQAVLVLNYLMKEYDLTFEEITTEMYE